MDDDLLKGFRHPGERPGELRRHLTVARIVAPEYFALSTLRLRIAGLLAGQFNSHVVTCQAFVIAGDDVPANCRTGTHG